MKKKKAAHSSIIFIRQKEAVVRPVQPWNNIRVEVIPEKVEHLYPHDDTKCQQESCFIVELLKLTIVICVST